ncbi:MAG: UvrD-helicase domain-containing protein [Bdellovibrionales bacterium]|nr:UvrD-helicase domain-containing protein [Bdellovibrionales bacterium]
MEVPASHSKHKLDLSRLNPAQREAVLHDAGPLLILAGAGSGKTNTMTHRIAYLIAERGVAPHRILGMSFTNKAANELKERVTKLTDKVAGKNSTKGLIVSTFHSLCVRILREFAPRIGFTPTFSIMDPSDQEATVRSILKLINIDAKKFDPSWILFQIGQAKNNFLEGEGAIEFFNTLKGPKVSYDDYSIALQSVFPRYQERLRLNNSMDFDDLIFNTVKLLEEHVDVREKLSKRFKYILVDEYQDTNAAQFRLLRALTCTHDNLCVVGDDDQSIYAWRGADPTHILQFDKAFDRTKRIILDQNYRSTSTILAAANEVISKNSKRFPKSLWSNLGEGSPIHTVAVEDDRAESQMVAEEIIKRAGPVVDGFGTKWETRERPWNDFAILYRSNTQSRIFEEALRLHQVPYQLVGALSFLDRKEIKDTLCYWRLVINPNDDIAFRRVINWPARGIGKSSIEALHQNSVKTGRSLYEATLDAEFVDTLNERTRKGLESFHNLLNSLRAGLAAIDRAAFPNLDGAFLSQVSLWAKNSLDLIGAKKALQDEEDDITKAQKRFENIDELANAIGMMDLATDNAGGPSNGMIVLQEYLAQLILDSKEEEKDEDEKKHGITLMTLHGAKGLEFPIVFLVGLEDGYLPHQRTINEGTDLSEERRLFYVGITRAKQELYLVRAKNRIRYGKALPRNPCRFLEDIPQDLLIERDESATPSFKSEEAKAKHEQDVADFFSEIQNRLKKKTP